MNTRIHAHKKRGEKRTNNSKIFQSNWLQSIDNSASVVNTELSMFTVEWISKIYAMRFNKHFGRFICLFLLLFVLHVSSYRPGVFFLLLYPFIFIIYADITFRSVSFFFLFLLCDAVMSVHIMKWTYIYINRWKTLLPYSLSHSIHRFSAINRLCVVAKIFTDSLLVGRRGITYVSLHLVWRFFCHCFHLFFL